MFLVLLMASFIGINVSHDYHQKDCAMNKYALHCVIVQGKEYCKKVIKPYCRDYDDGDYNYYVGVLNEN